MNATDADIVVPSFAVKDQKSKYKNSDMGSDCAYFSGPGSDEDLDVEEDTFNFNLQEEIETPKNNNPSNSGSDYADFQHQVIDDDDHIVEDFEVGFDEDVQDDYLQSQMDYMYSEDTETEE